MDSPLNTDIYRTTSILRATFRFRLWRFGLVGVGLLGAAALHAQTATPSTLPADDPPGWHQCQRLTDDDVARLACYDNWVQQQAPTTADTPPVLPAFATTQSDSDTETPSHDTDVDAARAVATDEKGCHDHRYSTLSRLWELEAGSSCGTLTLRGYRPLGIAFSMADGRPKTPTSPTPGRTGTPQDYQPGEMRINLSVRTKLAQSLFTRGMSDRKDSLWFSYSQQSTWQVFNAGDSRPFRTTDHEPELMYVYPTDISLPSGWRWRYAGMGFAHQSNGQSLPLSRSWNRLYLMGGIELGERWHFNARAWKRIPESAADNDNPDITRYIGRTELSGWWTPDDKNSFGVIWRTFGRGSVRLEWLYALGDPGQSSLHLHTQLFHGYGNTLLDYNRRRTVLSIGLSMVDF